MGPPMIGYVSGVYRDALVDPSGGSTEATEAQLGGSYLDPTGTGERTPDGHYAWAVQAHLAVARAGMTWDGHGPVPELELPEWGERAVLRPGRLRDPEQLARLQAAFPERRLRPFTPYVQAVLDPLRSRGVTAWSIDAPRPSTRALAEGRLA